MAQEYSEHTSKAEGETLGGPTEVKEVVDEATGELLSLDKAERVVLEGEGPVGKRPRRTVFLSPDHRRRLLEMAGKTKDETPIIPENILKGLKQAIASEKKVDPS